MKVSYHYMLPKNQTSILEEISREIEREVAQKVEDRVSLPDVNESMSPSEIYFFLVTRYPKIKINKKKDRLHC